MEFDWAEFYDDLVKKKKGDLNNLYYSNTIEHKDNIRKIFQIMGNNPEAVILDAGCGVGNFLIPLSNMCKFMYGIDISKESIKLCNDKLTEKSLENVTLEVSSITKIPLNSNSVDKILCFSVFHYLDIHEINIAIQEFKRILKKDGELIINFLNGGSPHGISTNFMRFVRKILKGGKKYSSTNITYKKLKEIIENEKGALKIFHSAYFYPRLFPNIIIRFISNRFYYERFFPMFLKKYGLSLSIIVHF